jgi:hypothetical protein
MISRIKHKILSATIAACLLVSSACSDDDKNADGRSGTHLDSFGPSLVNHGEDITFIGVGLDNVTAVILPENVEVPASEFKEQTTKRIVLTVPIETTKGKVILRTPQGNIESKSIFGLEYEIVISSMDSEVKPGENLTINGEFLNYVKSVVFFEGKEVTDFVSQSRTQLVVTVPMDAKTGTILLSDLETEPQVIESQNDLVVTLPSISALSPSAVEHAQNLTIEGTDLDLVTSVVLPGDITIANDDFVSQSETAIVLTVPVPTINGMLTLNVPSGIQVVTEQELSIILPVAISITPEPPVPGEEITITGTHLDLVSKIKFPSVVDAVTTFVSQGENEIVVVAPIYAETNGMLKFITNQGYETNAGVLYVVTPGPLPLAATIFGDELENGFGDWSYGGANDKGTTEEFVVGSASTKKTFNGSWDALRFAGSSISTSGKYELAFSIYGGPGTDGQQANLIINNNWGIKTITIVEGEWTEYTFSLSDLGNPASIDDWGLQAQGWSGVIYADHIGLR